MKLGLKDKVVVITGGSKGIGFAAARLFVEEGAHVLFSARSEDALNRACDEISTTTGGTVDASTVPPVVVDISSQARFRASSLRAENNTCAPSSTKSLAAANPIPLLPPVMTTTLSFKPSFMNRPRYLPAHYLRGDNALAGSGDDS